MLLGGLTGHGSVARDAGVLLEPNEVVAAAAAILRVFIDHGDRTDRKRARLKYLIERWGLEKVMAEAAAHLPFPWRFVAADLCEPRGPVDRHGHIGVHAQAQPGLSYIGVVLPASRLTAPQLRGLADIADAARLRQLAPDGVAEPLDLRHPRRADRRRLSRDRGARLGDQSERGPRRPRRLHRQCRVQILARATPSAMPWRSPIISTRGSISTSRSTST